MTHRSHYKPKRSPGGSPWGKAAANKPSWGKSASSAQPTESGPDSLPPVDPAAASAPPSTPGKADVTAVEAGNVVLPEGIGEDGRVFVGTQR